jgi:uncharacterized protein YcfJ
MKLGLSIAATLATVVTASTALANPPSWARGGSPSPYAESPRYGDDGTEYGRVTRVEPIVRQVRVDRPARECWDETQTVRYDSDAGRTAGSTILGGLIGGVIGHQIGHGDGRAIATVAGVVAGSAVGHTVAQQSSSPDTYHDQTVQRCQVRYQPTYEQHIDGYRVSYRYNGRDYVTQLPYDPGERIRVRVSVDQ